MVNTLTITPPEGNNPSDKEREIQCNEALYVLSNIKELAEKKAISLVTKKCSEYLIKIEWSIGDVSELINELTKKCYFKSEWCRTSDNGIWISCDVYKVTRDEYNQYMHKDITYDYYLKFSIGVNGNMLLIVSCHQQQY